MVKNGRASELQIWVSSFFCLTCLSLGFVPRDNYLIDCGSIKNTKVGSRVFIADHPESVFINTTSNSMPTAIDAPLYNTAKIFTKLSNYSFSIQRQGRHWIRLHFFPFIHPNFNLSAAKFSVSTQNFTLIREYRPESDYFLREYSLNISSDELVLTFRPVENSFAFISALEVVSIPDELIPKMAEISPKNGYQGLQNKALETVFRVNMGNVSVSPERDLLSRIWVSGDAYLRHNVLPLFVSNISAVHFDRSNVSEVFAPADVYGTAAVLNSQHDPNTKVNLTWVFNVDPGFQHLVRFHFCDITNTTTDPVFNVYINSWIAYRYFDLRMLTLRAPGAPFYMDFVVEKSDENQLNVSIGPPPELNELIYPNAILNGLEIMKMNNFRGSLDVLDTFSSRSSKMRVGFIVGIAVVSFIAVVSAGVLVLLLCRRQRRRLGHLKAEEEEEEEGNFAADRGGDGEMAMFSISKIGYWFPLVAVQEATGNFSESLVIGVGGFGKVYKGVLSDGTKVAVKRGGSQSRQGLAEFRTEIEMLSQFRHRHLVSLIGYCDERSEMIIIYEYMENGTLKDHLYGSSFPSLSWRRRLEICIGSARGLHYLHTGPTKAIIHRDVKSANILLDENFMAKVADFGLSKTGPDLDQTHVSTAVKGSFGYLDPEYLTRQQLTEKSDVYSFGVVMFEVLSGRPVIDPSLPREKVNLVECATRSRKRGLRSEEEEGDDIVDPNIVNETKPESLKTFKEIAEKCLAECGLERPSMGDVLWNLELALQLQGSGNEEKSSRGGDISSEVDINNHSQTSLSTTQFSVGDLADASMSKVFAQMVREEMREI